LRCQVNGSSLGVLRRLDSQPYAAPPDGKLVREKLAAVQLPRNRPRRGRSRVACIACALPLGVHQELLG